MIMYKQSNTLCMGQWFIWLVRIGKYKNPPQLLLRFCCYDGEFWPEFSMHLMSPAYLMLAEV